MVFRYCRKDDCGCGLNEPTLEEDLGEGQVCPVCGTKQHNYYTLKQWLIRLDKEVKELKKRIGQTKINTARY